MTIPKPQTQKHPLLGIGPMSKNLVDTIIDFSHDESKSYFQRSPILIIASRRQIEAASLGSGYVNNWSTEDFAAYVRKALIAKPAPVFLGRDHGGPWQGSSDQGLSLEQAMKRAKESYAVDIRSGFDVLHIDTSLDPSGPVSMDVALSRAFTLWKFCERTAREHGRSIEYIIGAEDADGGIADPEEFKEFLSRINRFCDDFNFRMPLYVVGRTGTLLRETRQAGTFNYENTKILADIAKVAGTGIQEHNGDYEAGVNLPLRKQAGVAALNVAPEFGVIETRAILRYLQQQGRHDLKDRFLDLAYRSGKWKKWLILPDTTSDMDKAIIAGHYVFGTPEFAAVKAELGERSQELDGRIRHALWEKLQWYATHLGYFG